MQPARTGKRSLPRMNAMMSQIRVVQLIRAASRQARKQCLAVGARIWITWEILIYFTPAAQNNKKLCTALTYYAVHAYKGL